MTKCSGAVPTGHLRPDGAESWPLMTCGDCTVALRSLLKNLPARLMHTLAQALLTVKQAGLEHLRQQLM